MGVGLEALLWGFGSAISLPLGALLGLWWKPKQKINSSFMAFGAGALLFALTIELFGHVPEHVKEHGAWALVATLSGALGGGLLFDGLNHVLNNRGAYVRKLSSAREYLVRLRLLHTTKLLEQMGRVKVLSSLPPELLVRLAGHVRKTKFAAGQTIFSQGERSNCMYFILEGQVDIVRNDNADLKHIATLGEYDTFGELGVVSEMGRSADAIAKSSVVVYRIMKEDFDQLLADSPELQKSIESLAKDRVEDLSAKISQPVDSTWRERCTKILSESNQGMTMEQVKRETSGHAKGAGAALAIWLGLMIDGIPESLVIGMLNNSAEGMSLAFIAGVFLANLPEAMSSSVSMQNGGMGLKKIMLLWTSICVMTAIGAFLGATLFPAEPQGMTYFFVLAIEGLAAGAMLTMIAETMLPEAFEQGGAVVGISTLLGFLAALIVKVS